MELDRIIVRLMADATQYNMVMDLAEGRLVRAATKFATNSVMTLATGAIMEGGRAIVTAASNYELAAASFETFTGSAEKGKEVLESMQKFAISTPFSIKGVQDNAKMLMGMGIEVDNVLPTMKALGSAAAGDENRLRLLALAFGQVQTAGKFMGGELRQFTESGIGAADFAKTMGVSVEELRAKMSKGMVGSNVVVETFNRLTAEGGRFHGMLDRMSQTVTGRWNALTETLTVSFQKIGTSFFKGFGMGDVLKQFTDAFGNVDEAAVENFGKKARVVFDDLWNAIKRIPQGIQGVVEYFTPAVNVVKEFASANRDLLAVLGIIVVREFVMFKVWAIGMNIAMMVLNGTVVVAKTVWMGLSLVWTVVSTTAYLLSASVGVLSAAWTALTTTVTMANIAMSTIFLLSPAGVATVAAAGVALIAVIVGARALYDLMTDFGSAFDNAGNSFKGFFDNLVEIASVTWDGVVQAIKQGDFVGAARFAFKGVKMAFDELLFSLSQEWQRFQAQLVAGDPGKSAGQKEGVMDYLKDWRTYGASFGIGAGKMVEWLGGPEDNMFTASGQGYLNALTGGPGTSRKEIDTYLQQERDRFLAEQKAQLNAMKMETAFNFFKGELSKNRFVQQYDKGGVFGKDGLVGRFFGGENAIGRMSIKVQPSGEAKKFATDIQKAMSDPSGWNGFLNDMRKIGELYNPAIDPKNFVGPTAPWSPKNFINEDAANFGRVKAFRELEKEIGNRLEVKLPPAMLSGTSEAMDTINRSNIDNKNVMDRVHQVLEESKKIMEEKRIEDKELSDAVKKWMEANPDIKPAEGRKI